MHYEIKFLCNNDLYSITLEIPNIIYSEKTIEQRDNLISICIDAEKKECDIAEYPHTIVSMKKSEDKIHWIEMI